MEIQEFEEEYEEYEEYEEEIVEEPGGLPVRRVRKRAKVDTSQFMTPYLAHSQKMQDLFSQNKYRHAYDKTKGQPYAITPDTPELLRIKKAQDQLSEVKYRMEGLKSQTQSNYDGQAKDIAHAKHVSDLVSKVLYRQKWDETKDKYLLPPDAPELVQAVKNAANYSKKLYTEAWDEDKTLFYPYTDSPELRRVAKAQEVLSDIQYKKGHDERKAKYTSLADPPEVELAKKAFTQRSDLKYHEDYNKNVKGKWCETPYLDIAVGKMAMNNFSPTKYVADYEEKKDQIYFMQTETPEYKKDYEKTKAVSDYNVLPATENPLLRQLRYAGAILSDKVYKDNYEKTKGMSINYCDTPKFKMDSVMKQFSDVNYKQKYENDVKGHYVGSFEDMQTRHCQQAEEIKSDKVYRQHPDTVKFTQVTDSPVQVQAAINAKQLSDLNYKAKYEEDKTKSNLPPDYPFFIQSRINAYNLSDNCYKYEWDKTKAKKFEIKVDSIPIMAARAHTNIASDVKYKKDFEKNKGQMIGALSIQDDPKILHSVHVAKIQSDREYKKDYEKMKTKYHTTLDMMPVTLAKKSQAIASNAGYKKIPHNYLLPYDSVSLDLAKKANQLQSENEYRSEYNCYTKGTPWVPFGSMEVEKAKKAADILNEKKYRQPPDTIPFTAIDDHPVMLQAKVNQMQRSDLHYKKGLDEVHQKYSLPPDVPEFIQAKCNAYNISKNYYKLAWEDLIAKGYDLKTDAIPIVAAKAARHAASDYQYKKAYEKAKGHHVGFRSLQDDPLLVHYMNVAKMQSDKEYTKDYHKAKLKYHTPVDMLSVSHAKNSSAVTTYIGYKQPIHRYTMLSDAMNLELARGMNVNSSDVSYKSDYENYVKGTGWVPIGSLDVEKVKMAGKALDEKNYRQHPDTLKFTSIVDSPIMVQAKLNAVQLSDREYKASGEKYMHTYNLPPDAPQLVQAKYNAVNISPNYYTYAHKQDLLKGHQMKEDAIPITAAKSSRDIASDYKYKLAYQKAKGHHVGFRNLHDDPLLVHYMNVAKMQSDRNYKKDYHQTKLKYHTPVDMLSVSHAKNSSAVTTYIGYRQPLHRYTMLSDAMNLELARSMMDIQTYRASGEEFKHTYNLPPDCPEFVQAKFNAMNMSEARYKHQWLEDVAKGYDLRIDAIPIVAAKLGRHIASNYQYHKDFEKAKGHHVGLRDLHDDPLLVHYMNVAKMQSDRNYKKDYHQTKVKYSSPVDMLSVVQAKQASAAVTNTGYRQPLHRYTLLPDAMNLELARSVNTSVSDYEYKSEYNNIMKGIGWIPVGSLAVETARVGSEIQSEKKYRTHPSKYPFTKEMDSMDMVLATANNQIMNQKAYTEAWNKDKLKVHIMPDSPDIIMAKVNQLNMSQAKQASAAVTNTGYRQPLHRYTLLPDAMNLELARTTNTNVSDYEYKSEYNNIMKGIGWIPVGSLAVETARVGSEIQSEKKYRTHPSKYPFTKEMDSMDMVLATANNQIMNQKAYTEAWNKDKLKVHIMPDSPDIIMAKVNQLNMSQKFYKSGLEELTKKGYDMRLDAISVQAAKASTNIASDYKYKLAYEKAKGHHVGLRDLHDDPLLVHYMNVAKMQSDRNYKKDYHQTKVRYSSPVDMLSVVQAKQASAAVTNTGYRQHISRYTVLPDAMNLELARNMQSIASDNIYKSEYNNYIKGIGWIPIGSLDVEKAKTATMIGCEKLYRQHPSHLKFTKDMQSMDMVLATANAQVMNKRAYIDAWENDKTKIHVMPDAMDVALARHNMINYSEKLYRLANEEAKKKGYDLPSDAISVMAAKASRDIASDYKYKQGYRKQVGHHIGARSIQDDPLLMLALNSAKIASDALYKKDFHKSKTKFNLPVDMMAFELAKKNQIQKLYRLANEEAKKKGYDLPSDAISVMAAKASRDIASDIASDALYKKDFHKSKTKYNLPVDMLILELAKKCQIQNVYKSDLKWLKGLGWVPMGSLDVEKVKKAGDVLSERKYRQHPWNFKHTSSTEDMGMVLAKANALVNNKKLYTEAWDNDKTTIHIMPDSMEVTLARQNKINYSEKLYKLANEEAKKKGYDLPSDAISVMAAKASRDIASDYKYKQGYRKQVGHHIGARSIEDDPLLMLALNSAKIASDALYKKDFNKSKTKYNLPVDMLILELAKKCQIQVNDFNYRTRLHNWTCLPDSNDVVQARKVYDLLSDAVYKSDLRWLQGLGWVPIGSLDVEKVKRAGDILSERKYRQHPSTIPHSSSTDSLEMRLYTEAWDNDKRTIHIMPDTPAILLAQQNKLNTSQKFYRQGYEADIKKGYYLPKDAISVKTAKASRDIASDYKYHEGYRKQIGHHIGARSIQDDPLLMLALNSAKIASDALYKKDFNKSKTKYNLPVDMLNLELAKKCQIQVNDFNYRTRLHNWTCLPDSNDVVQARKVYDLLSDHVYKSDMEYMKGLGWVPIGSMDVMKVKKAGDILNERLYRQKPDTLKYTIDMESIPMVLAKANAQTMNERLYTEAWDTDKRTIHIMPDTPAILLAQQNKINTSQKLYRQGYEETISKGYDLKPDAISITAAKASRDIASDYKYKQGYRKQIGHHIGYRCVQDDPLMMLALNSAKIASDALYKKDFNKSKTKYNLPVDMLNLELAKKCQIQVNDFNYRTRLHNWTCLPDSNDVVQARKAVYKSDLEWLRGTGWVPIGSLDVEKAKKAADILSEKKYRQPPSNFEFTSKTDSIPIALAQANARLMDQRAYTEAWEKDKVNIHIMPDTPAIILAQQNKLNTSAKYYRQDYEDSLKKGYLLPKDAILLKSAKASRDIISDYKYKQGYRKQLGHHIGARCVEDDPLMIMAANAVKISSDVVYKKDFHKTKTKYNLPVDMLTLELAKKCQIQVNDFNYRTHLHNWTCLPDSNDVVQARKVYDLRSDVVYKSDLEWLRGCGWMPQGSLDVNKAKNAQAILNERLYRQHPSTVNFTSVTDLPSILQAKLNADLLSDMKYKELWEKEKTTIHMKPDTPAIELARANAISVSNKLYTRDWDAQKAKGYQIKADAISVKNAKASRDIISNYKYHEGYRKQVGHHIGARCVQDDPLLVLAVNSAKIASDALYKKDFNKSKTKFNLPVDMLTLELAKKCQIQVNDFNYRTHLHNWTCLPDSNDVVQARKAYDLQSDAVYKSDLEWLRGIGWMPHESLDVKKVKNAQKILTDRGYRVKMDELSFSAPLDRVDFVCAKNAAEILNEAKYREAWHADKTKYTMLDTPQFAAAREAAKNINQQLYIQEWEKTKALGYKMPSDAVPIKHNTDITRIQSDHNYKTGYRKQIGHHVGALSVQDDPLLMLALNSARIASDALYKKDFNKSKTKFKLPVDMLAFEHAKKCQMQVNDDNYRTRLHNWTCLPDSNDVVQARKVYDLLSDNVYKSDLEWIRGCGWVAMDSVHHMKVKKAQAILNDRLYTKDAKENFSHYTHVVDRPEIIRAQINAFHLSDLKYKESFNLEKGKYIGSVDTPQQAHCREVSKIISEKLYKSNWDGTKATGYQLDNDYIPLVGARHNKEITSEAKYKDAHEKAKGHYMAGTTVDFPEVIHSGQMEKMKSLRNYRKAYEDTKTKLHIPYDMINHVVAKRCQDILSDVLYRTYLHQWTCHPDQNDAILARKANEILSDVYYKDDLNWMKGIGCYNWDTPEMIRAKKAYELQSDLQYKSDAKKGFNNYSIVTDTPVYVTAILGSTWASEKFYTDIWDKIKAKSYSMPLDSHALSHAKQQKTILSHVKYREDYEKFKSLYSLPKCLEDDPSTARCIRVGKLALDRLYKEDYERTKAKVHLPPDMQEVVAARNTQKMISDVDYRKYLHQWICLPDMQVYTQARKVNEQLSDIFYKDDLNWLKGVGCYVWDTPEILRCKRADNLQSQNKYKSKAIEQLREFSDVLDTPVYNTCKISAIHLSELQYRNDYVRNVRGTSTSPAVTIDTERARLGNYIQSDNIYKEANKSFMPTGYKLPLDMPLIKQAKSNSVIFSNVKYKEAYELMKAKTYTLDPDGVNFVNIRKTNKVTNERLYRELYHKEKDKIHTTYDTPEIRQVKATQAAVSDLRYKEKYFSNRGNLISLPITPELMHCHHTTYDTDAKRTRSQYSVVLETPEYKRVSELKLHLSNYLYTDLAAKERAFFTPTTDTPTLGHIRHMKVVYSEKKYKEQYEKLKHRHTSIADTPIAIRAKKAYLNASDLRYKDAFEQAKGRYHTVKDALDIIYHRRVTDDISEVKYREKYISSLGLWRSIPDRPELFHHRTVGERVSTVKYKEDLDWLKGIGCYVWDTPDLVLAEKNRNLYSQRLYKSSFEKNRGNFKYTCDTPFFHAAKHASVVLDDWKYKQQYEHNKDKYTTVLETPLHHVHKRNKQISDIIYKMEYNTNKAKGYTLGHDTPIQLHMKKVKDFPSLMKYREIYEKNKAHINIAPDSHSIRAAKEAYRNITNLDYKRKYEATKNKWIWTVDRPDFVHAAKTSFQQSDVEYKYDREFLKGCKMSVVDDKLTTLAKKTGEMYSDVKYKEKHQRSKGIFQAVPDTPQILHAKSVATLSSETKYKEASKKERQSGSFTTLPQTRETAHSRHITKLVSEKQYKKNYEKERGTSKYNKMLVPPDIQHAMDVAKSQSNIAYKQEAKSKLTYTPVADRPDIRKATQAAKLISHVGYRDKAREEASRGGSLINRPDITLATEVCKRNSQLKYKEKFDKEMKGKRPQYDPKESKVYKTQKEANTLASEYQYKRKFEESKGHYLMIPDTPEQIHHKEASELQSHVKYKEKYEKERGKAMLDFETPTYMSAKEAQQMQSQKDYKRDYEESIKGRNLSGLEVTPAMLHVRHATKIASEKEYRRDLEEGVKGKGLTVLEETPDLLRAKNATQILNETKYKQTAEQDRASYTTVIDTPDILHAQQMKTMVSQKKYKEEAEKTMSHYVPVLDTPEMQRVRENQRNFSTLQYQIDLKNSKGKVSAVRDTPELQRVKENQKNFSSILYKEDLGGGTAIAETPEMERVKRNQQAISTIKYKETVGQGTAIPDLPEVKRVRETQKNISSVAPPPPPPKCGLGLRE
ncbi:hypothetical protein JZ751_029070 [Albula glossodonta]|uniref:Nebulin n=1 Tax=Albula glossodonta TaxID=121402 RepID=A0A8T2P5H6_9TELE|nr:hypothetical protein JZ751_029070 [Albula glossodonta]